MAGKAITYPLARVSSRRLSAQAAAQASASSCAPPEINCTVLPNKLMVSSLDVGGPLSRLTIAFRTGPRNEVVKNLGISHVLRSLTGFATQKFSWFAIVRNTQQNGIHFTCTGDREVTAFHVVASRNKINCALPYLSDVVTSPAFKPWQVSDNNARIQYELQTIPPQAILMDHLHKACYRTGLGNSLFVDKNFLGDHTPKMLSSFVSEGFTSNRGCMVGYNIRHKDMLHFAKILNLPCNDPPVGNSKYFGGEIRDERNSYFAHVAVATEGAGLRDLKESLVLTVLQHAYGIHPSVTWGGSPSPLYNATHPVAPDSGVGCLNISYSDSGLFGFVVSSSAASATKAVQAAMKVLKSGSVSQADVNRAKAMVKMNLISSCENTEKLVEDIAIQSLNGGVVIPALVLSQAIDKVTHADVSEAAKKIASKKFSMAGVGYLRDMPYLDNLC